MSPTFCFLVAVVFLGVLANNDHLLVIELKYTLNYNCHSHYDGGDLSIHLNKVIVTCV